MISLIIVGLVLLALTLASHSPPFKNSSYEFHGTFFIGKTQQPVSVYADIVKRNLKVSYYGGTNVFMGIFGNRATYQIQPRINELKCFTTENTTRWNSFLRPLFANTESWTYAGKRTVSGVEMEAFTHTALTNTSGKALGPQGSIMTILSRNNVPTELIAEGFTPTGFRETSFRIVYNSFKWGTPDAGVFTVPDSCAKSAVADVSSASRAEAELSDWGSLFGTALSQQKCPTSPEFAAFVHQHGKVYADCQEWKQREKNYQAAVTFIDDWNRDPSNGNHKVQINHLADFTEEEILSLTGHSSESVHRPGLQQAGGRVHRYDAARDGPLPTSVDWRKRGVVSKIENQATCGNCWAFAAAQCVSSQIAILTGSPPVELSKQQLSDCGYSYGNNGCGGGLPHLAFKNWMDFGGIATEASYPFRGQDGWCNPNDLSSDHQVFGYVNVSRHDIPSLKHAIATVGPVAISIDARAPSFRYYAGGTITDASCANGSEHLDHAVNIVGYDVDELGTEYWIIKNQWSTLYGLKGYAHVGIAGNICGVADIPVYPLVTKKL